MTDDSRLKKLYNVVIALNAADDFAHAATESGWCARVLVLPQLNTVSR
jgi:hypothetical protein